MKHFLHFVDHGRDYGTFCVRLELACADDFGERSGARAREYARVRRLHRRVPDMARDLGIRAVVSDADDRDSRHSDAYLYFPLQRIQDVAEGLDRLGLEGDILDVPREMPEKFREVIAEEYAWRVEEREGPCAVVGLPAAWDARDFFPVRRTRRSDSFQIGLKVNRSDDDERDLVVYLTAVRVSLGQTRGEFRASLEDLARAHRDMSRAHVYEVNHVGAADEYQGLGLGAWLYAECARLAWLKDRAAIVSTRAIGGSESSLARRVWSSRRLSARAIVHGSAALWRDRSEAGARVPTPAPEGVTIHERPARGPRRVRAGE